MIFNLIVIVLIGVIVYFHSLQGFFSAGLSAVIAAVAAIVAMGYHEALVDLLLGGRLADQAHAVALVSLFAITYLVLRLAFDRWIPGNVLFPLWVDKIGGAAMGLVAGLLAVGVLVVAAQSLPLPPSIAGYERYPITYDKAVDVRIGPRVDTASFDQLDAARFLDNDPEKLWIAVDDLVESLVKHVSDVGGSLSTGRPFESVHPDYLQELFGQRVGIQTGSKHTALADSVSLMGVYMQQSLPQDDPERWEIEVAGSKFAVGVRHPSAQPDLPPLERTYRAPDGRRLLIVRLQLGGENADDKTSLVAFSPAAVRLVGWDEDESVYRNYFPIGTLESGVTLYRNAPDDPLFVPAGRQVDLVFEVDESALLANRSATDPAEATRIADPAFVEFKRLARMPLGGQTIGTRVDRPDSVEVVRKKLEEDRSS